MNERGVTRRAILESAWSATALALPGMVGMTSPSQASDGPLQPEERDATSDVAYAYMAEFNVPGLSLAIAKGGEIVKMVRKVKAWDAEIATCTHENGWCARL